MQYYITYLFLYHILLISIPSNNVVLCERTIETQIKDTKINFVGDHYMAFYQTLENFLTLSELYSASHSYLKLNFQGGYGGDSASREGY